MGSLIGEVGKTGKINPHLAPIGTNHPFALSSKGDFGHRPLNTTSETVILAQKLTSLAGVVGSLNSTNCWLGSRLA